MTRTTSGADWIWISTRWAIYARDGFACVACDSTESLSLDHVEPGTDNRPSNLVTLCVSCNSRKCARSLERWRPDLVDVVACAVASPIDRALGRALADEMRPGRLGSSARRQARRAATHRALLASLPTSHGDASPPPF